MTTPIPSWERENNPQAESQDGESVNFKKGRKAERDEIVGIAQKYQEAIHGGGNGRRIIEQMIGEITSRNQE